MNQKNRIIFLSILIFIVALFYLLATFLIIPDMQKSAELKNDIKTLEENIKNLQNIEENLNDLYSSISSYNGYLKYFQESLDKEDLENLFLLYGKDVKIEEIFSENMEKIIKVSFIVDFKIDSPIRFYNLINYINENSLPIKFDYRVIFEKNDRLIDVKFSVVVYSF